MAALGEAAAVALGEAAVAALGEAVAAALGAGLAILMALNVHVVGAGAVAGVTVRGQRDRPTGGEDLRLGAGGDCCLLRFLEGAILNKKVISIGFGGV